MAVTAIGGSKGNWLPGNGHSRAFTSGWTRRSFERSEEFQFSTIVVLFTLEIGFPRSLVRYLMWFGSSLVIGSRRSCFQFATANAATAGRANKRIPKTTEQIPAKIRAHSFAMIFLN
jgi:hypothetical protein